MSTRMIVNGKVFNYTKDPKVSSVELAPPTMGKLEIGGVQKHNGIFYQEMDIVTDNWLDQSAICHLFSCTELDLVPLIRQGLIDCGVYKVTNIRYYLVKRYNEVLEHFNTVREKDNAKKRDKQKAVHERKNDARRATPKAGDTPFSKVQWVRR